MLPRLIPRRHRSLILGDNHCGLFKEHRFRLVSTWNDCSALLFGVAGCLADLLRPESRRQRPSAGWQIMRSDELERRARAGLAAVREAGELATSSYRRRRELSIEIKGVQDLVSEADRACEDLIVQLLTKEFPQDSFLGEERGFIERGPATWVIDPIDGTANFLRGISHWCVSVGLVVDRKAVVGFVFDPIAGELFSAVQGKGALLNGEPIQVSGETDIRRARVGLGFQLSPAGRAPRTRCRGPRSTPGASTAASVRERSAWPTWLPGASTAIGSGTSTPGMSPRDLQLLSKPAAGRMTSSQGTR